MASTGPASTSGSLSAVIRLHAPKTGAVVTRIIRMVVVFPAPFGPRKPVTTPGRMEKDRSLTAMVEP